MIHDRKWNTGGLQVDLGRLQYVGLRDMNHVDYVWRGASTWLLPARVPTVPDKKTILPGYIQVSPWKRRRFEVPATRYDTRHGTARYRTKNSLSKTSITNYNVCAELVLGISLF